MLKGLTNAFKENCNKTELTYNEYIVINNEQVPIRAKLSDDCYENGNFIGSFILKTIQFETSNDIDYKNKEFKYYKVVNGESIKIGTFITTEVQDNDTTELVRVVGMDYGLKTQVEYKSELDYESGNVTLLDVWNECCELSGLESGMEHFENDDFIVDSDQFTSTGATIRDVFIGIALSSGSFIKVMNDDKIYLVFNTNTSNLIEDSINGSKTLENVLEIDKIKELQGNTLQDGTPTPDTPIEIQNVTGLQNINVCGKNLFDKDNYTLKDSTVTWTPTETGGTYSNTDTWRNGVTWRYKLDTNKTYTFKASGFSNNVFCYIRTYTDNTYSTQKTSILNDGSGNITKTFTPDSEYVAILFRNSQVTSNVSISNIQLEKGSTATEYKSFNGNTYEVNLGKNLLDTSKFTSTTQATSINSNTSEIDLITNNYGNFITIFDNLSIQKGNYTIWCEVVSGTYTGGNLCFFDLSETQYSTEFNFKNESTHIKQINLTNGLNKLRIYSPKCESDTKIKIWLIKGNYTSDTMPSFSPYFTPIELNKIGTYQDSIKKSNGKWYIEKQIGKVVLDGSENWVLDSGATNPFYVANISTKIIAPASSGVGTAFCNKYKNSAVFAANTNIGFELLSTGTTLTNCRIRETQMSGVENLKASLSQSNAIIYSQLATPTYTEITNEELINQLESIELLKGENNITITSEDLTPTIDLTYWDDNFEVIEDYTQLEDKRDTQPISCLRLGLSNVEGENVDLTDPELIEEYGENWLILNDNPFAYTQAKREQLITAIFNKVKGFGYSSFVSKTSFKPYLTCGDMVKFKNKNGDLIDSILLRYTHDFKDNDMQIELSAPSETSATVNYLYPLEAIDIAKRTEIIVDKERGQIEALTDQVTTIQGGLDNTYTKEQVDRMRIDVEGITNSIINSGGNNLLRNTGLWFEDRSTVDYLYPENSLYPDDELFMKADPHWEFWTGNAEKVKEDEASNLSGISLQKGYFEQMQEIRSGTYTLSFKYKKNKNIPTANANVQINDKYIYLTENQGEIIETFTVSTQSVNIKFYCDTDDGFEIYDLMLNAGSEKAEWSQHQNETTTDTVNISKGITIQSSDTHTIFKANSDGVRIYNDRDMENPVTNYTDLGMDTNRIEVKDEAKIVNVLWKDVGNNTWISRL